MSKRPRSECDNPEFLKYVARINSEPERLRVRRHDVEETPIKKTGARLNRPVDEITRSVVAGNIAWELLRTKTVFRKMLEDFFKIPDYDWWGNC